ncbi:MAG: ABC transporter permease, partial [Pseudomonadota bacterium]
MIALFNVKHHYLAFRELIGFLVRHRSLTFELAKREISDRYMGQVFGLFWTLAHPLIMMLIYVFIFAFVFKSKIGGTQELPLDHTTYLLAGLIPWIIFQDAIGKAGTVMLSYANLVKQLVFPVEVLPIKGVLASLVTQIIFLTLLIGYVLVRNGALPWTYSLLPLLLLLQTMTMIGFSYILSAMAVYFRDTKDFVQIFSFTGLFLSPIFYLPSAMPEAARPVLYLNPLSCMIWSYQDALYFG